MSQKKHTKKRSSLAQKNSKNSKLYQKDDLDNNDQEILEALQARLPFYKNIFKQLTKMGLPMLEVQPNEQLINRIERSQFNVQYLQRLISMKLEGQPISYHRCKLAHSCKYFLNERLQNYQRFELEEMLGLIKESVEPVQLKKIPGINLDEVTFGQEFDYQKFLNLLDSQKVFNNSENLKFISTDIRGYYEMKNIEDLKDHANIETFQKVRKLRILIFDVLRSIKWIIDSLESQDIDTIEEAFISYLDLKKSSEFPFTEEIKCEESETNVQLNRCEQLSESSAKSSVKSVKFHNQLTNSEMQKKNDQVVNIQSILKNTSVPNTTVVEQQSKNQLTMIKEEQPSQEKVSIFKEIIPENLEQSIPQPTSSHSKSFVVKCKKSSKRVNQDTSLQKWDLLQQNNFEKIFYEKEYFDSEMFSYIQQQIQTTFCDQKNQTSKKKLHKQSKRKVHFELCDSNRFYNGKLLELKPINPRNPFCKYSFIDYDLDSEEEEAEDVLSEIRSQDETPSSSLQEFIELDYKNQYQQLGEPYALICDDSNFESFLTYRAIMLSDNKPQISSKKSIRLGSKFQSKSSFAESQNEKLVKALSQLSQFVNPEQVNKILSIQELEIFHIIPQAENKESK
ncbi:unnamed protein product (macronuclear) [Paramecium tetraurelia]|uniref:Uncharacterized protein n=1 Tax=Paramecium tetraurelia TaxID=5888 RepID=A0E8X4_PARTE|nr:uncharacterized protein GSPATT00024472001 [Paramecium tetraurelia]CAK91741.1 unnamed protein product [Paramecium tetraurelia]|eukprot:XP_001459138.1 hypothetical protein (macronuclear) [Paramecium tetraurelia strain d4-2]